jgi:hypothetical protein
MSLAVQLQCLLRLSIPALSFRRHQLLLRFHLRQVLYCYHFLPTVSKMTKGRPFAALSTRVERSIVSTLPGRVIWLIHNKVELRITTCPYSLVQRETKSSMFVITSPLLILSNVRVIKGTNSFNAKATTSPANLVFKAHSHLRRSPKRLSR